MPNIFIFDLDGTLSPTRELMGDENAFALCELLKRGYSISIITGSELTQIMNRVVARMPCANEFVNRLYFQPTSGARMYVWNGTEPVLLYEELINDEDKELITHALAEAVVRHPEWFPEQTYGPRIDDRGTQISLAGLGRDAPREEKEKWDPQHARRNLLVLELAPNLPNFTFTIGGTSTIDVTRKGIDKAYGIGKLLEHTGFTKEQAVFIGDGVFPGGNDYGVQTTGVQVIPVNTYTEIPQALAPFLSGTVAAPAPAAPPPATSPSIQ